jgi:hypothetical protein
VHIPDAEDKHSWWRDVYGFDFKAMQSKSCMRPQKGVVRADHVLTRACTVLELNTMECAVRSLTFDAPFHLRVSAVLLIKAPSFCFSTHANVSVSQYQLILCGSGIDTRINGQCDSRIVPCIMVDSNNRFSTWWSL